MALNSSLATTYNSPSMSLISVPFIFFFKLCLKFPQKMFFLNEKKVTLVHSVVLYLHTLKLTMSRTSNIFCSLLKLSLTTTEDHPFSILQDFYGLECTIS